MQNTLNQMSELLDEYEDSADQTVAEANEKFSRLRELIREAESDLRLLYMKQDHGCYDQPCGVCAKAHKEEGNGS